MSAWAGFRADANPETGIGHFMRCLSLARAWKSRGGQADFLSTTESGALIDRLDEAGIGRQELTASYPSEDDQCTTARWLNDHPGAWLVIDGYQFDDEYYQAAQVNGARVLVIDDFVRLPKYHADALLDQNAGAENRPYPTVENTTTLLGSGYAMLAPEYRAARETRVTETSSRRVLITLGGSDPAQQTVRVARAVMSPHVQGDLEVRVIVGPANSRRKEIEREVTAMAGFEWIDDPDDMPTQMAWADVAVVSGGTTMWELACVGVPMVTLQIARNQVPGTRALAVSGAGLNLGRLEAETDHRVGTQCLCLLEEEVDRLFTGLSEHLRILVDLAAGQIAKNRNDIFAHMACADRVCSPEPEGTHDALARDFRCGDNDYR